LASLALLTFAQACPADAQSQSQAQASAPAADGDEAFYQRAATCAAALEVDQLALVARARRGAPNLRPQILDITLLGFTYVGVAYEKGLRDPRADQMLSAARAEQKSWPAARHAAVAGECRKEAQGLYDHANAMEQWFANKRANARVDRFMKQAAALSNASGASTVGPDLAASSPR
jgi:hypothetical protein